MTARPCSAPRRPTAAAPGASPPPRLADGSPQLHGHGDRCGRQHQRRLGGAQRDGRYRGADAPAIASFSTDSGTVGDGITNDNTLTLTGTAAGQQHGAGLSTAPPCSAPRRPTAAAPGASPPRRWPTAATASPATATDAAGNISAASAALSVTVDTAAPDAPAIASFSTDSGTAGDGITNDNTLTLTGTAEANSTVQVYDGATLLGTATANGSGAWTFTTATLADGSQPSPARRSMRPAMSALPRRRSMSRSTQTTRRRSALPPAST